MGARCGATTGRIFRGTLMVEIEQYRGSELLREWFDLAMAYNATMQAKAPNEKPVPTRRAAPSVERTTGPGEC